MRSIRGDVTGPRQHLPNCFRTRAGVRRRFPSGPLLREISQVCAEPAALEEVVSVASARIAVANYGAIAHDFAHVFDEDFIGAYREHACSACASRTALCPSAIDRWLLDQAAFVSLQQARHSDGISSPITHGEPQLRAWRPRSYGRALVLPVRGGEGGNVPGLIDVKGCGVGPGRVPTQEDHSNGLDYLGTALADFFYSWIIDDVFARTEPNYVSVPVYAVVDLGFDIQQGWAGSGPAGLHIRRAHARVRGGIWPPLSATDAELVTLQMELLLRAHGLTTASMPFEIVQTGDGAELWQREKIEPKNEKEALRARELRAIVERHSRLELINIQLANSCNWEARSAQIVDFGHVHARRSFGVAIASQARDAVFGVGRIITPDHAAFLQPDPRIAVNTDFCSRTCVNAFGFHTAMNLRNGRMTPQNVSDLLRKGRLYVRRGGQQSLIPQPILRQSETA